MTKRLAFICLVVFPLFAVSAFAQDSSGNADGPTERKLMMYRVTGTLQNQGQFYVIIPFTERDGLFLGASGVARSVYQNAGREGGAAAELGPVKLVLLNDTLSVASFLPSDSTQMGGLVYENDVIEIATDIPFIEERSVFFDFVTNAIGFLDNDSELLFSRSDILLNDGPETELDLTTRMAELVKETGEMIRPDIPDNPQWDITIEGGRFAGMKLVDAMDNTSPENIKAFLLFVKSFPGKYLGKDWKINETYATWLINAAPPGQEELRDMFLDAMDTPLFDQILAERGDELRDGIFTTNWNNFAEALGEEGKFEEAYRLSDVVARVATYLDDQSLYGYMLFSRADIAASQEDREKSIELYKSSIEAFEKSGDMKGKSMAVNNLGNQLNGLDRYSEANLLFVEAINLKIAQYAADPEGFDKSSLASSYYGRGTSLSNLGELDEAIRSFRTADSLYVAEGSLTSQRFHVRALTEVGKTLIKQNLLEAAISEFRLAYSESEALGNIEGQADALDEIGYAQSLLAQNEASLESYTLAYELHIQSDNIGDAGFSKSQAGQTLWRLKRYDEAIAAHLEAISLREKSGQVSGQAYSWMKLGDLYKDSGDPIKAIESFGTASGLYEQVGNRSGSANVLEKLGDLYVSVEVYSEAISTHLKALQIRQDLGLSIETGTSLNDVASAYYQEGNYAESKKYYSDSATLRRNNGDQPGLVKALANLGNIAYFSDREYETSQQYYAEAIKIAETLESTYDLGYAYRGLGHIAADTGKNDEALELYKKSYPLFSDTDDQVDTLLRIGYVNLTLGRFSEARDNYDEAFALATAANSRQEIASALNALGGLEITIGQPMKSLQLGMESLRISEEVENPWGMASGHVIIGNAYNVMGTNELAIHHYSIADSIWTVIKNDVARATPINNIGTIYYHQGDYAGSLPFFTKALGIQNNAKIKDDFTAMLLGNVGAAFMKMGEFGVAENWLNQAIDLAKELKVEPTLASTLTSLGELRFKQGAMDEAMTTLVQAKEVGEAIGNLSNLTSIYLWMGKVYEAGGQFDLAITTLTESATIAREITDNRTLWQTLATLGSVYQKDGQKLLAIENLTQSAKTIELLSGRLAFGAGAKEQYSKSDDRTEVYEKLIALLIEEGQIEQALSYIEQSNNEALRKSLAGLQIEFANPEKTEAVQLERERKAEIDALDKQIATQKAQPTKDRQADLISSLEKRRDVAEQDYIRFVNQTVRSFPELAVHLSDSVNPKDLSKVKGDIPPNTAVVAYLVGNSGTFIFVATADTVVAVAVDIAAASVNEMVNEVHASLKAPGSGATRSAGSSSRSKTTGKVDVQGVLADLYRLLVAPIEEALQNKEYIAIIPSGSLHKLPFQVLSDPENGKAALVDDHVVYYTSNLDIFSRTIVPKELKIVAFGNADESLDWSEREVSEIAEGRPDTQIFLKGEATESRVKNVSSDYNVLHLATHGTLDYNDFENSYLTLAKGDGETEDGHLTIAEIWSIVGLENYRLVTLSACETAVNDDISNGWPISPANAFLDHVPSVIASLWEVDDVATSILMQRFYENLESMGTAQALQLAQLSLSSEESYADPFYWAPFVVMGDWR